MATEKNDSVLQLQVIVEAEDFDAALAFYRDTLGLPEQATSEGDGDARVSILNAGRATLEISNPGTEGDDRPGRDGRTAGSRHRLAFEVSDGRGVTARLTAAGATIVGEPRETPWRSLISRLDAPAGLQITVFEET